MRLAAVFVLVQILQSSYGQVNQELVNEYVQNITEFQNAALSYLAPVNSESYQSHSPRCIKDGVYDFIIIGAGSSGAVVANRLSEIENWNVLLLEAGTWENNMTDIPNLADYLRLTPYNWGYNSTSQASGLFGYLDNSVQIPRGKALGGSSVINAMLYARGNKNDYDNWAALGNPGWSYKEVLPYFKKSEHANFTNASSTYHGFSGPINIQHSPILTELGQAFLDANVELGRPIVDYNGEKQKGVSRLQLNEINGRRDSSGKGFISPARNRTNLLVSPNTLVIKILIDNRTKNTFGVQYLKEGQCHYALVKKEVIVSAGALNTPQILMLSGIGPKKHLEELGIPVIKNLPVGQNLFDHMIYDTLVYSVNYSVPNLDLQTSVAEYLQGTGPLSAAGDVETVAYVSVFDGTDKVPDVEHVFHSQPPGEASYSYYAKVRRYTEDTYNYVIKPTFNQSQARIHSLLLHPKSRGNVTLKSRSPLDFPLVNPNYLHHPADVQTLVNAIKDQFKIFKSSAWQKYNATLIKVKHPLCNNTEFGSDNYWVCMVRTMAQTVHHFAGSCSMGPKNYPNSVVSANLTVHGIRNLRIADCSVIPSPTSGHTNSPGFMIGEKAGDIIKQFYGKL